MIISLAAKIPNNDFSLTATHNKRIQIIPKWERNTLDLAIYLVPGKLADITIYSTWKIEAE